MKVLDQLPTNFENRKIAWILRHAQRKGQEDALTGAGLEQAAGLGKKLSALPVTAIYASPTDRCTQTAQAIARELPGDVPVILDYHLNETGIYVTDMQKAIETYKQLGPEEFFRRLFTDQKLEGYNTYSFAAKTILDFVRNNTTAGGLTLFITHQFIIRMLNHYVRGLTYRDKVMKVDFLQGLILDFEN